MNVCPPRPERPVLATDLDGTLIPLDGHPENEPDLRALTDQLRARDAVLVFSTGRHFAFARDAMLRYRLPRPDWLICDVGTSVYRCMEDDEFVAVEKYRRHLERIVSGNSVDRLRERLESIEGLRLQEPEKQGRFKLSYYADAERLVELAGLVRRQLERTDSPYDLIHSVDPFNGDGLIDLLPASVSKAHALDWWVRQEGHDAEKVVFAGDSGNDLAALTAGYRAIVVGNADRAVAREAFDAHRSRGWRDRLFLARGDATSGVLEGCRWFGLAEPREPVESSHSPDPRLGATPVGHDRTEFRVWAPNRRSVSVELLDGSRRRRRPLSRQEGGYFSGLVRGVGPGARYRYALDDEGSYPDPASRYQPTGVHGASQVVAPDLFPWTDRDWPGVAKRDLVIYELHVGAFTGEGTFRAAIDRIPELVRLGVTAVEIMPVAQTPGRWNWGYDGVDLFAVRNTYGRPEDFKALVDACHRSGLAVILDVVYNHLGPEGNYLSRFGPYFSRKHRTPWGEALNFDGRHCRPVRDFVIRNALYWLDEYHLDGLRLDAVHFMLDDSRPSILEEIGREVSRFRERARRHVHLIAEANVYDRQLLSRSEDGGGYDAIWCDCLMHSIYSHALPDLNLTHRDYEGTDDLARVLQRGYIYAGDLKFSRVADQPSAELPADGDGRSHVYSFVTALQTHDGVGNHPLGKRIHHLTSKSYQRAAAALTLLYPSIPLIFMGEEYAADCPFPFFADFEDPALRKAVDEGRAREYPQHVWKDAIPPSHVEAFRRAACHRTDLRDSEMFDWYRRLLALRRQGIADGWLSWDRMTTEHDARQDLFCLRFDSGDGGTVELLARLVGPRRSDAPPVTIPSADEVLLSSEPLDGQFALRADHALICRRYS